MANEEKTERDLVQELITRSEDEFEKKLTYICAGALLLSVTLLEKVIKLDCSRVLWILIMSWIFLVLSLVLNLISHLISKVYFRKNIDEIDDKMPYEQRIIKHRFRLTFIESLNWISAILLILGISALVLFSSVNAMNPHKQKDDSSSSKTIIIQHH